MMPQRGLSLFFFVFFPSFFLDSGLCIFFSVFFVFFLGPTEAERPVSKRKASAGRARGADLGFIKPCEQSFDTRREETSALFFLLVSKRLIYYHQIGPGASEKFQQSEAKKGRSRCHRTRRPEKESD